jgi:hypothetical protein
MTWLPWVDYREIPGLIRNAAVCLGIFGDSDKASRVIPNKMFQILAAGGTIITRDSPAVTGLARQCPDNILLVAPADADALANAMISACSQYNPASMPFSSVTREALSPDKGVSKLLRRLKQLRVVGDVSERRASDFA